MINILIGIFYIALIALISYLLYFIVKVAIKDAYYELELNSSDNEEDKFEYYEKDKE